MTHVAEHHAEHNSVGTTHVSSAQTPANVRGMPRPYRTLTFQREQGPFVVDIYDAQQPTGAAPILLIHGWGGTGNYWQGTAHSLSQTAQVIVPDLPGTGRSQPVAPAQDLWAQVDALVELLDWLGLERVQLVGHSMGGAMALLLTDKAPQRVQRIVLISLSFFMSQTQARVYRMVMGVFKLMRPVRKPWLARVPGMSRRMAKRYFHNVPDDQALLDQGLRDFLELDPDTATACADDATTPAIPAAGAKVQVPVLLIACREDGVMPTQNVAYTVDTIPDCRVHWIEDCGHMPMIEKPDEYFAQLRAFLDL
jgi:pimeloyl-ACP methyl ester carboxylesterase